MKIKIDNELVRDTDSFAVINSNRSKLEQAKEQKYRRLQNMNRLDRLENEMTEIKALLQAITKKMDKK